LNPQYKKQQRHLQYRFKQHFTKEISILTIDQCQGQEADIVLLSLVQKPTRFLTLNRFNVALSRVRKKLYLLADMKDFQQAARNEKWDCHLLARDLIEMGGGNDSDSDDNSYF
jgi:superfamily I DNA and/or RNA helicase